MTGLYAQIVCHSFLQRRSPKEREELLKLLPEEDAIALATLEESELPIPSPPPSFVATLDQIHPSWLAPFLLNLPVSEIPLFLHALCPSQVSELK